MEVSEIIKIRKSVRAYASKSVPNEILNEILESGRLAPSAMNYQPWHFVVVTDENKREILSKGRYAKFLKESPVVIVGCGDQKKSPKWYVIDVAIAMQNMILTATSKGLGTCWIGSFHEEEIKKLLKIPENFRVVALMALGYPRNKIDLGAKIFGTRNRKRLESIVSFEEFGQQNQ